MKKLILLIAVILGAMLYVSFGVIKTPEPVSVATTTPESKVYVPTHAQTVWLHALEWCESSGVKTIINPADSDGLPSYYSFQFRPSTFKYYAIKYNVLKEEDLNTTDKLMTNLSKYDYQFQIVAEMINDNTIKWRNQFPGCIAKIGLPPKY